jgi:catechol 2,3-dioxygenase-like lactoylglutathione lyase family enzyme
MLSDKDVCAAIGVSDLVVARKFYEEKLGLKSTMETPGGVFYESGNGGIFIYPTQYAGTNKATYAAWSTKDVEGVVAELKAKGVVFEHYDGMPDTKLVGDVHVMGEMKSAWFKDPDGNILNIVNQGT